MTWLDSETASPNRNLNLNQFQYTMFEPAGKLADPAQTIHDDDHWGDPGVLRSKRAIAQRKTP